MKFGIVTPIKNPGKEFVACLASVKNSMVRHLVCRSRKCEANSDELEQNIAKFGAELYPTDDVSLYDAIDKGFDYLLKDEQIDCFAWINSDEQILSGTLEKVSEFFEKHPDVDVVYGDYLILNKDGCPISARREIAPSMFLLKNGVNYIMSCTVFMRRRVIENSQKFDLSYKLVADKKFYLEKIKEGFKLHHLRMWMGAYTATGCNASLNKNLALEEQARLRKELGSYENLLLRYLVRIMRCVVKLFSGCYFVKPFAVSLHNFAGEVVQHEVARKVGWKDE